MTKQTNYLVTVTDVNQMLPPITTNPTNSNRAVIKNQVSQTAGSVGVVNNWYVDTTAVPFNSYTSNRLPRFQDLLYNIYNCGDSPIINSYDGLDFYLYFNVSVSSTVTTQVYFNWTSYDRPNRFDVYDSIGLRYTTGWVGYANYAGPWGASLNTATTGSQPITWLSTSGRYVSVAAGPADPSAPLSDTNTWNLTCITPTTTTTTTLLLTANGTYVCSLGTSCNGQFNISSVSGGSGPPYQTSYVVTGFPASYNAYPATNSYINLCGGTSYTFCLKGSAGDTRCAAPATQCSITTTTTTSTTSTTTTLAPVYYYNATRCHDGVNQIVYGGNSYYGTGVVVISGITSYCYTIQNEVIPQAYDDTVGSSVGGCGTAPCYVIPTTTTTTTTCNPTPNWQNTGFSCYSTCNKYNVETDQNPCSPTYNTTRQGSLVESNSTYCGGCCGQSTAANWVNNGAQFCSGCTLYQPERDNNPCSPTYNQTRNVSLGISNNCGSWNISYYCQGCAYYSKETNSCTGDVRNVTLISSNSDNCGSWNISYYCSGCGYYSKETNSCTGNIRNVTLINGNSTNCGGCCGQSTAANWVNSGSYNCYGSCTKYNVEVDNNGCSPTYNQTRQGTAVEFNSSFCGGCCGASPSANWVNNGSTFCSGCYLQQPQIDDNPCSSTYQQTRDVDLGVNTSCGAWVQSFYCVGYNKWTKETNTCTGSIRNNYEVEANSPYCGYVPPPACRTYQIVGDYTDESVNGIYTNCSGGSDSFSFFGGPGTVGYICAQAGSVYVTSGNGSANDVGGC